MSELCRDWSDPALSLIQLDEGVSEDYVVWTPIFNSTGTPPTPLHGVMGLLDVPRLQTLLFGGCDPARPRAGCSAAMAAHSIERKAWTPIPAAGQPSPRSGGTANALGGDVYLFGGDAAGVLMNDLVVFHPSRLAWSRTQNARALPAPDRTPTHSPPSCLDRRTERCWSQAASATRARGGCVA